MFNLAMGCTRGNSCVIPVKFGEAFDGGNPEPSSESPFREGVETKLDISNEGACYEGSRFDCIL